MLQPRMTALTLVCLKFCAFVVIFANFGVVLSKTVSAIPTTECEYYNETLCNEEGEGCNATQVCEQNEPDKRNHCYVLWQKSPNNTNGFTVKMKGCWLNHAQCFDKPHCVETREDPKKQLLFCCCEGNMCNNVMHHIPMPPEPASEPGYFPPTKAVYSSWQALKTLIITLVPMAAISVIVVTMYWYIRRNKLNQFNEVPTRDPTPQPPSPLLGLRPVQLLEIKARGRFGAVWKAQMINEYVAVKILPIQEKNSWIVERDVFMLPQMKHDNILAFVGAEKRGDNLQAEFWLITSFHENGSLCDYLKANLISWNELCHIAITMMRGLTHLHEELPPTHYEGVKPAVAHRDFKSKNVLLKHDLSACIADFGLTLQFAPGKAHYTNLQAHGQAFQQVGTRRYMAPEVLEGAISFSRDAFLRIDMYACGLVLWELLARCTVQEGPLEEYMLPFEEEVGLHPGIEDMQQVVATDKKRPKFKDSWLKNPNMASMCNTVEECWDHDAEARLSANCVLERLTHIQPPSFGLVVNLNDSATRYNNNNTNNRLMYSDSTTSSSKLSLSSESLSSNPPTIPGLPKESSI